MSGRGLTTTERNAATAPTTIVVQLVEVLFDSGPLRLALGGIDVTSDGVTWYTGNALQLSDSQESSGSTEGLSFTLSGLDMAIVALAAGEPYKGRIAKIYEAWLDEGWRLVAPPRVEWIGRMSAMTIEEKDGTATVTGSIEHYEAELQRPRSQRYTAADQHRKYTGDLGCDLLEAMTDAVIVWPNKEIQKHEIY
jgi:hypothetical protein